MDAKLIWSPRHLCLPFFVAAKIQVVAESTFAAPNVHSAEANISVATFPSLQPPRVIVFLS